MAVGPSFRAVRPGPPDPINLLKRDYDQDTTPTKVDLGVGVLRDHLGLTYELPVLAKAKRILQERRLDHDYRPTTGKAQFRVAAAKVMLGADSTLLKEDRVATVQTVAGTGACRVGAVFLNKHWPSSQEISSGLVSNRTSVYFGIPTWGNYEPLFRHAGFDDIKTYPHLNDSGQINMHAILYAIDTAAEQSIFVFQGCCHNPTGRDYTPKQWQQIADHLKSKRHFAFMDTAYQGLGASELDDVWAVRQFAEQGIDMLVAQSFSKNFGLYSERVGALHVICASSGIAYNVADQLRSLIRWEVSSSPAYGSELVSIVLSDPQLLQEWRNDLATAKDRVRGLRSQLYKKLTEKFKTPSPRGTADPWKNLIEERGLFSFTGLSPRHIKILVEEYHIYLPTNGRINVSGLNEKNIEEVAQAFDAVVRGSVDEAHL
ncbi:aspartate aminotransferase [Myriangium duriaei CBS 260.36]|uniref:Aspartate aminotransferase n=1 Tax=Myriangium duriaei CBS 260.36 TaxID=1168546 RepID=A0A9P4IZN0_9PEZI|nr:aspartate aminotransferase [Myriangium duriaei CBS 260.36]